ncbi:DoxX family membrane protein [Pontibacter sp. MBLB2868]|uniref:DoxX family membrane protein n=1 Tax=Pontibacter sp. MBLB2868 TaxID=3451555 RepID=UPI003F750634
MLKNKDLLTILIRLFLGYIFFSAGVCKLTHGNFGQIIGPPWLEERLAQYGLGLFAQVVAVSQIVCGILLFSQRFSLLGAIMLVPMNLAILAVTVSQKWVGTPFVNSAFLLLNLLLIGLEYRKFLFLIKPNQPYAIVPVFTDRIGQNVFSLLGVGFGLLTLLAASYNVLLTNIFALIAFLLFALTILRSCVHKKLDVLLLVLPFVAMVVITLGKIIPNAEWILGITLLAEALLLAIRLYTGSQKKVINPPASAALS